MAEVIEEFEVPEGFPVEGDRLSLGVAANRLLRERAAALGVPVHIPARELCTDNAAMIGSAARFAPRIEYPDYLGYDAFATPARRAA